MSPTSLRPCISDWSVVPWWLEPVWEQAHAELAAADDGVVVGYSLPPNDFEINRLLATSTRNLQRIRIYDPYAEKIAARWSNIAPSAYIKTHPGLSPSIPASATGRLTRSETERRRQRALSDPRPHLTPHSPAHRLDKPKAA